MGGSLLCFWACSLNTNANGFGIFSFLLSVGIEYKLFSPEDDDRIYIELNLFPLIEIIRKESLKIQYI